MTKATPTLETNAPQPLLRLAATDILQPNDLMIVVDYPREELTLTVENFDYQHDSQSLRSEGKLQ